MACTEALPPSEPPPTPAPNILHRIQSIPPSGVPRASRSILDSTKGTPTPGSLLECLTYKHATFAPSLDITFTHSPTTITHNLAAPVIHTISFILCQPRVCGGLQVSTTITSQHSLVDGGANINITNNISNLTNVHAITPFQISVAVNKDSNVSSYCTHYGMLPLSRDNGKIVNVKCYYCPDAVETIISPAAVLALH